jgi:hypothetical protein
MNEKSEQLRSDFAVDIAPDDCLRSNALIQAVVSRLGKEYCTTEKHVRSPYVVYEKPDHGKVFLLIAAVSFLGGNGNHPVFKKRIQMKRWYKEIAKGKSVTRNG